MPKILKEKQDGGSEYCHLAQRTRALYISAVFMPTFNLHKEHSTNWIFPNLGCDGETSLARQNKKKCDLELPYSSKTLEILLSRRTHNYIG
jgi:hypothetical protein